jgi:hypothetical protein
MKINGDPARRKDPEAKRELMAEADLVDEAKAVIDAMKARGAEVPIPTDVVTAKAFSADAVATVRCFETQLAEGLAVPAGIAACRAAPVVPGVRPDAGAPDAGAPAAPPAGPWVRETQTVVRDGVADWLRVDDGSKDLHWKYLQRKGLPKEHAVRIDVEDAS